MPPAHSVPDELQRYRGKALTLAYRGRSVFALIPARGGSKGIPRKNLRELGGISLVARASELAASIEWLDDVIVSTDDLEIANQAERHGARSPFMRPPELASDRADTIDVWRYSWERLERDANTRYDLSVLLEPTCPLRRRDDVERAIHALVETGADAVTTVSPMPAQFSPHKTLIVDDAGRLNFYLETGARHANRQTIPQYHHRNGACYVVTRENLVERGQLLEGDIRAVILDRPMVNVDDEIDLKLAQLFLEEQAKAMHETAPGKTGG